jgi:uncharacterized membrane protein
MRKVLVVALVVTAALMGCNKKSEEGGGAGNETFKVVVPTTSTDVKQGEVQIVKVSIERGSGFKQAVKLQAKAESAGITVDPDSTTVQPADKGDVQLKITAAKDAPLGASKILVKGTPDKGEAVEIEFKVNVVAP